MRASDSAQSPRSAPSRVMRMRSATRARMLRVCAMPATKLTGIDAIATSDTVWRTWSEVPDVA